MLRYVVLDYQLRSIASRAAAVDFEEVRAKIVVIIFRKAQAELRHARFVDVGELRRRENFGEPVRAAAQREQRAFISRNIEVAFCQRGIVAERAFLDIHQQFAVRRKGRCSRFASILKLERGFGDDCAGGQSRVKGENRAVLFICRVIADVHGGSASVELPALVAGFSGFKNPAILSSRRLEC